MRMTFQNSNAGTRKRFGLKIQTESLPSSAPGCLLGATLQSSDPDTGEKGSSPFHILRRGTVGDNQMPVVLSLLFPPKLDFIHFGQQTHGTVCYTISIVIGGLR